MPDAFYEPAGEGYLATELTRGPWDPGAQHAGPPAALLGRELELLPGSEDFQLARVTYEILRSVPIGPVALASRVLRPGRRVRLVESELAVDGEPLMRATAWQIQRAELDLPAEALAPAVPPPPPRPDTAPEFFPTRQEHGYHTGMEVSFVSGSFVESGPASVWLRMRRPLVAGEEPTPLQRVLIAADVGNGVSSTLDYRRFLFINVELSVHLERMPAGEWIHLAAETHARPTGVGTSESVLSDAGGRIGRAAQSLLVSPR